MKSTGEWYSTRTLIIYRSLSSAKDSLYPSTRRRAGPMLQLYQTKERMCFLLGRSAASTRPKTQRFKEPKRHRKGFRVNITNDFVRPTSRWSFKYALPAIEYAAYSGPRRTPDEAPENRKLLAREQRRKASYTWSQQLPREGSNRHFVAKFRL
jgi:hypothetical protein